MAAMSLSFDSLGNACDGSIPAIERTTRFLLKSVTLARFITLGNIKAQDFLKIVKFTAFLYDCNFFDFQQHISRPI